MAKAAGAVAVRPGLRVDVGLLVARIARQQLGLRIFKSHLPFNSGKVQAAERRKPPPQAPRGDGAVDATILAQPGCRQRSHPASGRRQQIDDNMRNVMQAWALTLCRDGRHGGGRAERQGGRLRGVPERLRKTSGLICEDCGTRGARGASRPHARGPTLKKPSWDCANPWKAASYRRSWADFLHGHHPR
jgi:hypothetical protein